MIEEHTQTNERHISYSAILGSWRVLEGAFQLRLGIDLEEVWASKTWRWFSARVAILLADDNPFARLLNPAPAKEEEQSQE